MTFMAVVLILFVALFVIADVTHRRFGVLVLATAAGSVLASSWSGVLTPIVASYGLSIIRPPLVDIVAFALTLAPALLLLLSGPSVNSKIQRIGGALIFATFVIVSILDTLKHALIIDDVSRQVLGIIDPYTTIIITVCLVLAIFDTFLTHTSRRIGEQKRKKDK